MLVVTGIRDRLQELGVTTHAANILRWASVLPRDAHSQVLNESSDKRRFSMVTVWRQLSPKS